MYAPGHPPCHWAADTCLAEGNKEPPKQELQVHTYVTKRYQMRARSLASRAQGLPVNSLLADPMRAQQALRACL